jgi:hypothetical protein
MHPRIHKNFLASSLLIQIKKVINNENLEILNDKNIHDDMNEQKSYGDEMKYIN